MSTVGLDEDYIDQTNKTETSAAFLDIEEQALVVQRVVLLNSFLQEMILFSQITKHIRKLTYYC